MATGALDANGVWKYGEDDPLSPFSTFMNLGMNSVSTAIAGFVGGAWTAYVPTIGGVTLGNGTMEAAWLKVGRTYRVRLEIGLGTTSAVTGEVSFTLPVAAKDGRRSGTAVGRVTGSGNPFLLACWAASSSTVQLIRAQGANGLLTTMSATNPGTWASTGWIEAEVVYEAA